MKLLLATLLSSAIFIANVSRAADPKSGEAQLEQNTRLQIFLDNTNFGPGKIDGRGGEFTKKALAFYKQSQGQGDGTVQKSESSMDTTDVDLTSIDPVFTTYTVTGDDLGSVGELPEGPEAQSKVKRLPYATGAEAIAEKFHCDIDFLKELNPQMTDTLSIGDQLTVPNVKPFELSSEKKAQPGPKPEEVTANKLSEEAKKTDADSAAKDQSKITVCVSVKMEMVEVFSDDKIVAAFPVTVGSALTESPVGNWSVKAIAKNPTFRHDVKMLNEGKRGSEFFMLPPGPNNPVGVVWIALSKDGIGIHGTNDPDSIGRSSSHGCIRMANWDAVRLAGMLKLGVEVTVE